MKVVLAEVLAACQDTGVNIQRLTVIYDIMDALIRTDWHTFLGMCGLQLLHVITVCMVVQKLHSGLKQANVVREKMAAAPQSQLLSVGLQNCTQPSAILSNSVHQGSLDRQSSLPGQQQQSDDGGISKAVSMPGNHASLLRAFAADCQSQCSPKASGSPHSPHRHILGTLYTTKSILLLLSSFTAQLIL